MSIPRDLTEDFEPANDPLTSARNNSYAASFERRNEGP
jgi:hypothetical protein